MKWNLRYAPHLGYRPPFEPLFRASVGSDDAVAHIEFAHEMGFAGVLYAAARSRPADEQERVGRALAQRGMEAGCMLYTTFDKLRSTMWAVDSAESREQIALEIGAAIEVAQRTGARRLAVLGGADPLRPMDSQHAAFARNLNFAADMAACADKILCLETLSRKSIPHMLLGHMPDAVAVAKAADHPAVRLIFDTSHVQIMDGDLFHHLDQAWDLIDIVQLADNPGRLEPGSGEINFENLLAKLLRKGYAGLVELEHGWSVPGLQAEREGLERLRLWDQQGGMVRDRAT